MNGEPSGQRYRENWGGIDAEKAASVAVTGAIKAAYEISK
jgi:hypothetical protein